MDRVVGVFEETFDAVEEQFPDLGTVELFEDDRAGSDNGAGADRQFAYCKDGSPLVIAFAPKSKRLSDAHLRGLMRHEFGHALEYRYGVSALEKQLGVRLPAEVERRADAIAEAVWGEPIEYDVKFVQCVGAGGVSPRPKHLPDEMAVLRANGGIRYRVLDRGSVGFFVRAYDGKKLIGSIGALAPGADKRGWFRVSTVGVADAYQRRGIGTELYRRASEEACARGGKGLRSEKFSRSPSASRTWEKMEQAGVALAAEGGHDLPCSDDLKRNTGTLTAYHGTHSPMQRPVEFREFRNMDFGPGFYLATDAADAAAYGSHVYEAEIDLKNPIRVTESPDPETLAWLKRVLRVSDRDLEFYDNPMVGVLDLAKTLMDSDMLDPAKLVAALQKKGYDGFYVEGAVVREHHTGLTDVAGDYVVVWSPEQILSWREQ